MEAKWTAIALSLTLISCAKAPLYQATEPTNERAYLKVVYDTDLVFTKVAKFSHIDSQPHCGKPINDIQTLAVLNRGNPLISEVNPDGLPIAAGRLFRLQGLSIPSNPKYLCGLTVTFKPKAGTTYEATLRHHDKTQSQCILELAEVSESGNKLPPSDFAVESCIQ